MSWSYLFTIKDSKNRFVSRFLLFFWYHQIEFIMWIHLTSLTLYDTVTMMLLRDVVVKLGESNLHLVDLDIVHLSRSFNIYTVINGIIWSTIRSWVNFEMKFDQKFELLLMLLTWRRCRSSQVRLLLWRTISSLINWNSQKKVVSLCPMREDTSIKISRKQIYRPADIISIETNQIGGYLWCEDSLRWS